VLVGINFFCFQSLRLPVISDFNFDHPSAFAFDEVEATLRDLSAGKHAKTCWSECLFSGVYSFSLMV
jgi:hypothetical protein